MTLPKAPHTTLKCEVDGDMIMVQRRGELLGSLVSTQCDRLNHNTIVTTNSIKPYIRILLECVDANNIFWSSKKNASTTNGGVLGF